MPILDDNDPISILQKQIEQLINRQDGHTVIAALSLTLSSVLAFASSKQPHPMAPAVVLMRTDLIELTAEMVRARAEQTRES